MFPLIGLTEGSEDVPVRLVGDRVPEDVGMTVVGYGTTEDSPDVGKTVMSEPLVEGVKEEDTRETEIVDEATGMEELVKTIIDGDVATPETALLCGDELAPEANITPDGTSSADEV